MDRASDREVLLQQVERIQQVGPVVLSTTDQRKLLSPRIADVDRDIPEILGDPPQRDRRGMPVSAMKEIRAECRRNDELHQGPAEEADELAERTKHQMAGLVNREVETVEKPVVVRVKEKEESVEREYRGEGQPRAPVQRVRTQRRKADGESPVCCLKTLEK